MLWVLDYLDDLDADFRAFYNFPSDGGPGIADGNFGTFSAARFFKLAERTSAYSGVIAARFAKLREDRGKEDPSQQNQAQTQAPSNSNGQQKKIVTLHELMLIDPTLIQYERW